MSFARKLQRNKENLNKTSCCGKQMTYKESVGTYICERCGKTYQPKKEK